MLGTNPINSLFQTLEGNHENFQIILDKFIKNIKEKIEKNEEFQKEFQRIFKKSLKIYQIIIKDIDQNFYLKITPNKITYMKDLTEIDEPEELIIPISLTREALISILKREETISTLYMRGTIVIRGGFTEVIKIRNFIDFYYALFLKDN